MFTQEEGTLEVFRLVVGPDEVEAEAEGSITEYLIERGALYGKKLGREKKKVKEFDVVKDPLSGGWVLIFMCERYYY